MSDYLRKKLDTLEGKVRESEASKKRFEEFKDIDTLFVGGLSDKELAAWQSKYPANSPQFILANHEWQRRLNAEQIKSNDKSARIGILGVILGAVIAIAASHLPNKINNGLQTDKNLTSQSTGTK